MSVNKYHVEVVNQNTNTAYGVLVNTTDENSAIKIAKRKIKEQYGLSNDNIKITAVNEV